MYLRNMNLSKTLLIFIITTLSKINSEVPVQDYSVKVNKCCLDGQVYHGTSCEARNRNESLWTPFFTNEQGTTNIQVKNYKIITGLPDCLTKQPHPISHYYNSTDKLRLLPDGVLRHYFDHLIPEEEALLEIEDGRSSLFYDYEPGKYCLERRYDSSKVSEFAWVCAPNDDPQWTETEFLMRNVISPITHGLGMCCLLIVAIVYFIMPTLRDLVGNIVTMICLSLIVSQAAGLIRLLTVFNSHISLIITETFCYVSMLGAFFWLNSLGFYIWKTFKSRNVFLRITDGRKFCYYSMYTWTCTFILGTLAVFAHYTMDYPTVKPSITFEQQREEMGSLGVIIFFMPIAFTILMDVFFLATTLQIITRMHTYGRIHHKLRHSFRMFILLLMVMTITWICFLLSFFKLDALVNAYIAVNAFQGPLILYICIYNQKHVSYLIRKTCCYQSCGCQCCQPEHEPEWGDEMTAMNTTIY